tara:strand:- start:290 stop:1360 length:1071 start_codon:yes stop_codon:yes gene_type:complete
MVLPVKDQIKYWTIAASILLIFLWLLGDILLPFVLGAAIAYLLDPIVDRLERLGTGRVLGTILILMAAFFVLFFIFLLLIPLVIDQFRLLAAAAPDLVTSVQALVLNQIASISPESEALNSTVSNLSTMAQEKLGIIFGSVMASAISLIDVIMLMVITPVVAVYLLVDWDRILEKINELLPLDHASVVRSLASEIDSTLSAFVRGMIAVCLVLGIYYATALSLIGLEFGLIIGFIAGLVSFIPYVGALLGGVLAIGLALIQFWGDFELVALVVGVFIVGQIFEGNILTPKLVGNSVGLHPVSLILALSLFGAFFGFIGLLLAVPLAASAGVILRFFIKKYKMSRLFLGENGSKRNT